MVKNNNKKAISPVVATALLLVVAVVAVVGFQTWFTTYQSGLNTKVETQSNSGTSLTVERLEQSSSGANATVYIKNSDTVYVTVNEVKVLSSGTELCSNTTLFNATASSVTEKWAASCSPALTRNQAYDVVLITDNGVFSASMIAR